MTPLLIFLAIFAHLYAWAAFVSGRAYYRLGWGFTVVAAFCWFFLGVVWN